MLDGITVESLNYVQHSQLIFEKFESMFDVEKRSLYYPDYCFDVIITYRNPRHVEEVRKVRIHRNTTQMENFLWSQLSLEEVEACEQKRLIEFLSMKPTLIYWDFVLGIHHTAGWDKVWNEVFGNFETIDQTIRGTKLYVANHRWKSLQIKFYRINPERNLKYNRGLMGLTKAEIVAKKLIARDPWIHPWKGNDSDLQGAMLIGERELTEREKTTPDNYLQRVKMAIRESTGEEAK